MERNVKLISFQMREFITGRNEVVAKVMFLHVSVILFTGGGLWAGRTPPWTGRTPRTGRTPTPPPLGRENPPGRQEPPQAGRTPRQGRTPPGQGEPPPDQADPPPPWTRQNPQIRHTHPGPGRPPREADSRIRSTSGRYASYWNAFLLLFIVVCVDLKSKENLC